MSESTVRFRAGRLIRAVISAALLLSFFSFSGNSASSFQRETAKVEEVINYKDFSGTRKLFYKRSLTDLFEEGQRPALLKADQHNALLLENALIKHRLHKTRRDVPDRQLVQLLAHQKTIPAAQGANPLS